MQKTSKICGDCVFYLPLKEAPQTGLCCISGPLMANNSACRFFTMLTDKVKFSNKSPEEKDVTV
jgi:hypothetical protein